jgi:hypothetical protein
MSPNAPAFEKHYTISEICSLWGIGRETLRKIVSRENSVVKIRLGRNRKNTHYLIPASTLEKIHTKLLNGG